MLRSPPWRQKQSTTNSARHSDVTSATYFFSGLCQSNFTVEVMPGPDRLSFVRPRKAMPDAASRPHRDAPVGEHTGRVGHETQLMQRA